MKTVLLSCFAAISVAVGCYFLMRALCVHKGAKQAKRVLSAIQVYTIGVFISVVLVFIPIYYTSYDFGDRYSVIRPLLIAVHNSLRIFIMDGDFDIIVRSLSDQHVALRVCFSLYTAFLYVIAPILTFGNVLSLFKNIKGELRYRWHRYRKHYIMSELNEKSIALAKNIYSKNENAVIVFADVFAQNEEGDYELLMQAREMNAICLKRDVAHLDFLSKKGNVEIFLIGNDESENVSQAVRITTDIDQKNIKHNIKVFVFSAKPSAAHIIDSVRYDNLLQHGSEFEYDENCFKLRRIDEKQQLIWNTVPKMKLLDLADRNGKTLAVTIVGFGSYGMELFKMLVWYCQVEGYRLMINIVDKHGKREEEKDYIASLINRDCRELMQKNGSAVDGEAQYDIRVFPGVDALTSDLDDLLLCDDETPGNAEAAQRLRATNLAFVSLGDDDRNIEVAIHLRSLFDRVKGIRASKKTAWKDEAVEIYSVVYDERKFSILYNENTADGKEHLLLNHKDMPFHIHFIGGMSSQFAYQNIYDPALEKAAFAHHRSWVSIEEKIHNEWMAAGDTEKLKKYSWDYKDCNTAQAAARDRRKYEQYEYYRRSSIAKELYQRQIRSSNTLLQDTRCLKEVKKQTCQCENCIRRKKSEHMRWNAYTRTQGYVYSEGVRADRALYHNNLCGWEDLTDLDRLKD